MKVSELMAKLSQFAPDEEIKVYVSDDNPLYDDGHVISNVYQIQGHDNVSGVQLEILT